MFKPNIVSSGLLMSSSEKKKKKNKKNEKSNETFNFVSAEDTTLSAGASTSYNDPAAVAERAIKRKMDRDQSAYEARNRPKRTPKEIKQSIKDAEKIFKNIRKNQGKATATAKDRQSFNTGGVQEKVDAAANACVKPQGCGTVSPKGKEVGKKFDVKIAKGKNKAYEKKK